MIDLKIQAEALLAELVVKGLSLKVEPCKVLLKRRVMLTQPQGKNRFILPHNIN